MRDRGPGTLGGEWQCVRDCHSGVNVPGRYAQRRVAVRNRSLGTLGGEWQCVRDCHSGVNVLVGTFRGEWQCRAETSGSEGVESGYVKDHPAV